MLSLLCKLIKKKVIQVEEEAKVNIGQLLKNTNPTKPAPAKANRTCTYWPAAGGGAECLASDKTPLDYYIAAFADWTQGCCSGRTTCSDGIGCYSADCWRSGSRPRLYPSRAYHL